MAQRYRSSRSGSGAGRGRSRNGGGSRTSESRGSRGGYRQPARGGGGGGAAPIVIAVVLVLGAVGAIVAFSSGKSNDDDPVPTSNYRSSNPPPSPTSKPDVMKPPAYPPIGDHLRQKAKDIASKARELKKEGEAVYQEAMTARRNDDQDLWQEKLTEAGAYFEEIKELYNELIAEMPSNNDYDEEEVANHYLGREADVIMQATRRLADIKKQRRM